MREGEDDPQTLLISHHQEHGGLIECTWSESKKLWQVAAPSIFSRLAMFSVTVVTQSFAGHLSDLELAAISIATTVIIAITFGFMLGMASALETLCGQAYGAKQYHMLGTYMQRSWVVLFPLRGVALPPFCVRYAIVEAHGTAGACGGADWFGGSVVDSISLELPISADIAEILAEPAKDGNMDWFFGSSFVGLWDFFKLSLASGFMLLLENFYFRSLVIVSGYLHNTEIAVDALSICMSIYAWESMIPLGFLAAVGVRVANELGASNAKGARFATTVSVMTFPSSGTSILVNNNNLS
ncbi:hypothetical protein M0R45_027411 [Rubus argutus]|uniref:Uncharacterized protein n=1 Tax=Rubus argutus TaxID=59490 RepID=A0AAW1X164_RUBAR